MMDNDYQHAAEAERELIDATDMDEEARAAFETHAKERVMSEELKPCPHCNGRASIECRDDSSPCIVMCGECYAVGPERETAFDAITAWNRRTPPRVKALEWSGVMYEIASPLPYQIWSDNGGAGAPDDPLVVFSNCMLYDPFMIPLGEFETPDDAKAAAQADFTRRVHACLEGYDD